MYFFTSFVKQINGNTFKAANINIFYILYPCVILTVTRKTNTRESHTCFYISMYQNYIFTSYIPVFYVLLTGGSLKGNCNLRDFSQAAAKQKPFYMYSIFPLFFSSKGILPSNVLYMITHMKLVRNVCQKSILGLKSIFHYKGHIDLHLYFSVLH